MNKLYINWQFIGTIVLCIAVVLQVVLIVISGISYHKEYDMIEEYNNKKCDACEMCNINDTRLNTVGGVFYPSKGFYCVYTEGKNATDINDTETHERCHALINMDNNHHFCKERNNK